jgi:hypothetical protein
MHASEAHDACSVQLVSMFQFCLETLLNAFSVQYVSVVQYSLKTLLHEPKELSLYRPTL